MTTHIQGGPIMRVVNSPTTKVAGNVAIPVYVYASLPADAHVLGGPAQAVVFITAAQLRSNGGQYSLEGRPQAVAVQQVTGVPVAGGPAIPVYNVTNLAWP